jgi:hypothetical protein
MACDADRGLLFGLIAPQVGLVGQARLVAAFQAWARDKTPPLAGHLTARGDVDDDSRAAVEATSHAMLGFGRTPEKDIRRYARSTALGVPAGPRVCEDVIPDGDGGPSLPPIGRPDPGALTMSTVTPTRPTESHGIPECRGYGRLSPGPGDIGLIVDIADSSLNDWSTGVRLR